MTDSAPSRRIFLSQLGARSAAGIVKKHKFEVKAVPSNFMNGQRISTHLFNSERDMDTLVAALRSELT